ncbi:MAG: OsmC family protein [Gammaproteobacteria bacterium]|nr:OsmC family protein [Gammaproteobacteria bacterium]
MTSIESSFHPLIFKIDNHETLPCAHNADEGRVAIRTMTRALEGMQKEAIVHDSFSDVAWRMVCDEGPWLNGTDLSSFPLGFFSAGMIATLASEIMALANQRNVNIHDLKIIQDTRYSMEGSAIKRTMTGSALPIETEVNIKSDATKSKIEALVYDALAASPADAVMRSKLSSQFKITKNGQDIDVGEAIPSRMSNSRDPAELFNQITPSASSTFAPDITRKLEGADTSGERQGQAVGMASEQKRLLEVRAVLTIRDDNLKSIQVQCIKPEGGSVFNFLSDEPECFGGQGRAPTGLQYLSAGVSFCFMTQLGRFAGIVKQDLQSYRNVQDTVFSLPGASANLDKAATAEPVDTHVFITSSEDDDVVRTLVDMGEQTCYLHACYRSSAKTRLRIIT